VISSSLLLREPVRWCPCYWLLLLNASVPPANDYPWIVLILCMCSPRVLNSPWCHKWINTLCIKPLAPHIIASLLYMIEVRPFLLDCDATVNTGPDHRPPVRCTWRRSEWNTKPRHVVGSYLMQTHTRLIHVWNSGISYMPRLFESSVFQVVSNSARSSLQSHDSHDVTLLQHTFKHSGVLLM